MLEWSCTEDDDLTDTTVVKRANPASFVTEDFSPSNSPPRLASAATSPLPREVWTDAADAWLTAGAWQACARRLRDRARRDRLARRGHRRHALASAVVYVAEELRVGAAVYEAKRRSSTGPPRF